MKNGVLAVMVSGCLLLSGCYAPSGISHREFQRVESEKRLKIGVVDFQNKTGDGAYDGLTGAITGTIIDGLQKTRTFRLIERQRLESVLGELKLNMSGLLEPENAKQVGKQLGVDALLFGNLSSVKYSKNKQTIFIMWTEAQRIEVSLDARLVNIETGELMATAKAPAYVSERSWVAFGFAKLGKTSEKNSIVQTGVELACRQIADDIAGQAY